MVFEMEPRIVHIISLLLLSLVSKLVACICIFMCYPYRARYLLEMNLNRLEEIRAQDIVLKARQNIILFILAIYSTLIILN
jgi:heme/copper-type cytochrome/quinol oxidase subunit 2